MQLVLLPPALLRLLQVFVFITALAQKCFKLHDFISCLAKGIGSSPCTGPGVGCSCITTPVTTCTACSRTGSDYSYSETLSPLSATGQVTNATVRTIKINGCPNHAFTDYTPNTACKGTLTMTVPALPRYMSSTTNSLASTGGNLRMMKNQNQN